MMAEPTFARGERNQAAGRVPIAAPERRRCKCHDESMTKNGTSDYGKQKWICGRKARAKAAKYKQSPKGKIANQRYNNSPKGKAVMVMVGIRRHLAQTEAAIQEVIENAEAQR